MGNKRHKRGLINAIGDIAKTLFGTLSNNDLEHINEGFDQLYTDNKNMAQALQNHTKILKVLLDSSSINYGELKTQFKQELSNAEQIRRSLNNNTRNLFVTTKILTCAILIEELAEDINTLLTAINNGKHGIVHPQILTPQMLTDTIRGFETIHRTKYHLEADPESYQHIIDISEVNVAIVKQSLIYVIKIPILEKEEYVINHIIPIPQKIQNTHLALIPEHEFIFQTKTGYVPTDKDTLNKCKDLANYKICHRNQPDYRLTETDNCDASIIKKSQEEAKCTFSPFKLHSESYILTNKGYIILPTRRLSLDLLCGNSLTPIKLTENTLVQGPGCTILTDNVQLYLERNLEYKKSFISNISYNVPYDKNSLDILEDHLITLPKEVNVDVLKQMRLSLDDTENLLSKIGSHHRFSTLSEKALEWLKYLGYASIILIMLYTSYKCGFWKLISKCIPKKICVFCVKTNVHNAPSPTVIYSNKPSVEETPLHMKNKTVKFY